MNRQLCAAPRTVERWQDIDFAAAERSVKKLQMRIAKAVKQQEWGRVKALQWTLTHSFYAKALAVKQVTENKGKRTSGVDHELWDTPSGKNTSIVYITVIGRSLVNGNMMMEQLATMRWNTPQTPKLHDSPQSGMVPILTTMNGNYTSRNARQKRCGSA